MDPDIPLGKPFPDTPLPTDNVYTGPFRAQVKKNNDNEEEDKFLGRIKVWVPQVHGEDYKDRGHGRVSYTPTRMKKALSRLGSLVCPRKSRGCM